MRGDRQSILDAAHGSLIFGGMKTADALDLLGSQVALAVALGISQSSVAQWGDYPPALRQLQIEALTGGKLRAESDCNKYRVPQSIEP